MKVKRLLFLVMAICLASGVKAQFYDSADDIYYYVKYEDGHYTNDVKIFNFDGKKACILASTGASDIQKNLKQNSNFYAEKVETTKYDLEYKSNSHETCYVTVKYDETVDIAGIDRFWRKTYNYVFSYDRKTLKETCITKITGNQPPYFQQWENTYTYKKVDKSYFLNGFFGVGRQRK